MLLCSTRDHVCRKNRGSRMVARMRTWLLKPRFVFDLVSTLSAATGYTWVDRRRGVGGETQRRLSTQEPRDLRTGQACEQQMPLCFWCFLRSLM